MTSTPDTATVNRRVTSINETLIKRVTAHLEQFGTLARPVLWTGKSSLVVHFTTDLHVVSMDTRFEPLMLNWTQTFRSPDGAIYLNVPAAWRKVDRETGEGEPEVKPITAPMKDLLTHLAAGATIETSANVAVYPGLSRFEHFKHGTFTGLIERKYVELVTVTDAEGDEKRVWVIADAGLIAIGLPPKSAAHDDAHERFSVGDHAIRKSDKVEFHVTAVDGDFISGVRWYGVEVPAGARRAIGQPDTKVSARVELIERAHRKHFTRVQDEQPAPILDPTAPLPASEITNADEPHDDIGTLVSDEAPLTVPDQVIVEAETTPIVCPLCGDTSMISTAILGNDPVKCPVCGKFSARWQWEDDHSEVPSQSVEPLILDRDDTPLRVNDWVKTLMPHYGMHVNAGERGAIVGLKNGKAVVTFPFFKTLGGEPVIAYYLPVDLRKIDPPEPTPDPVNDVDAYAGAADAALTALEQADIERAEKADPYAWATPERRAEVRPILEKLTPMELEPTTEDGVWLIEDATTEKTMRRGLNKFGVTILSVEEGESVDEDTEGEPYTIARFSLGKALETPFPSKRQTKPVADPNSIHAQYDALHSTLPAATQLLIQANGDEWLAFQMDAMLLRRYAPLCRFSPQTVNSHGEQWDKLSIPAGLLDETVTNANEGGVTVALIAITHDEAQFKMPRREVTAIHAPGEPVQYVGHEDPPVEADEETELAETVDDEETQVNAPIVEGGETFVMTPELMAAKIKLHIHGALRLGLLGIVRQLDPYEVPGSEWFDVFFIHPIKPYIVKSLEAHYDIENADGHIVTLRPKQSTPHGSAIEQAVAVIESAPDLSPALEAFAAASSNMAADMDALAETLTGTYPAVPLLDADGETALLLALETEHPDLLAVSLGVTQFALNVIDRMRTAQAVAAPF